ncbi:MAG: hypothetical protein JSV14_07500 [Deltaproteobacteria bacterium]|jgi:hypothetical protein|nr:MAG: hypothetical protein JSV14_07500 [Deltaproteobacteria bacterium]
MTKGLTETLTRKELDTLTRTLVLEEPPVPGGTPDTRPKLKYMATAETTILKIMNGAAGVLEQKGMPERAADLRRIILTGAYGDTPIDAIKVIKEYVRLKIMDEAGKEIGGVK